MGDNGLNINATIMDCVPDKQFAFPRDFPLNLLAARATTSNFPVLTNATTPSVVTDNGFITVQHVSTGTASTVNSILNFMVPGEYNTDKDVLYVLVLAEASAALDTTSIDVSIIKAKANVTANQKFIGPAATAAVGVAPGSALASDGAHTISVLTPFLHFFKFSGKGFQPHDAVQIKITTVTTGADVSLLGVAVRPYINACLHYVPDRFRA